MEATARKSRKLAVVAGITALAVGVAGATYAWFYMQDNSLNGSGNAAKISLDATDVTLNFTNVLPGEEIDTSGFDLQYAGTRYAIMRLSLAESGTAAALKAADPTTHDDWLAAYDPTDYAVDSGTWYYTKKRLNEILNLTVGVGSVINFYPNADGTAYYALVAPGDSNQNVLTTLDMKFTGEFGGGYINKVTPGAPSASRQFEQESIFTNLGLDAAVVQCTQEAVSDVWGAVALGEINAIAALQADITGAADAAASWAYIG